MRSGRPDLAELLAELGARRRADPLDALMGACLAGDGAAARRVATEHPDAAELLRTAEADVLGRWAADGRREAVEVLLDLGVPIDARGPTGLTALQEATRRSDPELGALLLRRGADPRKRAAVDGPRAADEPPYGELAWAAHVGYVRLLATSPLAERRPCGDGLAVITGVESNSENGVVCGRLERDVDADATIAETLALAARRPVAVAARRSGQPGRPARASRRGRGAPGAHRRGHGRGARPPGARRRAAARHRARAGARRGRAAAWAQVVEPAEPRTRAVEVLASLGLGAQAPLQHRLALRDGVVMGAASFFAHGETVLGQHLAVAATERRAGIGRALAQACAREALAAGARVAVVEPTPDTVAFHRLLGFALRAWPRDRSFYLPLRRG